jgi:hypothetical protein
MPLFAKSKEPFCRLLKLENGVPSHDTFTQLLRQLDPDQFPASFERFMAIFPSNQGVVAIDDRVCGALDCVSGKSPCIWSAPGVSNNAWREIRFNFAPRQGRGPNRPLTYLRTVVVDLSAFADSVHKPLSILQAPI